MEILLVPENIVALLTITFLEIVLGIDNIVFISIAAKKLEGNAQKKARNIGLVIAMVIRILMLFGIGYFIAMQEPWFSLDLFGKQAAFSGQAVILIIGGLFLLYKATSEIHHNLEGPTNHESEGKSSSSMTNVILQIVIINVVFSFDSILTAVGLTEHILIMMISIIVSVLIMMAFAKVVGDFVTKHPTIQMLGLAFLLLIGFMLIAEGAHLAHLIDGAIPKGYLYFAIFFSLTVEMLNMRLRKRSKKVVELHKKID